MAEKSIVYCGTEDETEWAIPGFYHLYYCPFCGTLVKGQGWGAYVRQQGRKSGWERRTGIVHT